MYIYIQIDIVQLYTLHFHPNCLWPCRFLKIPANGHILHFKFRENTHACLNPHLMTVPPACRKTTPLPCKVFMKSPEFQICQDKSDLIRLSHHAFYFVARSTETALLHSLHDWNLSRLLLDFRVGVPKPLSAVTFTCSQATLPSTEACPHGADSLDIYRPI